jgi:hypothetical protein
MAEKKHAADDGANGKAETGTEKAGAEGQGERTPGSEGDGAGEPGPGTGPGIGTGTTGTPVDPGAPGEDAPGETVPGDLDEEIDPAEKALAVSMFVSEILASPEFVEGVRAIVVETFKQLASSEMSGLPSFDMTAAVSEAVHDLVAQGVVDAQVLEAAKQREAERQAQADEADAAAAEKAARKRAKEAEAAAAKKAEDERVALEEATDSLTKIRKLATISDDEEREELRSGEAGVAVLRFADAEKFLPDMSPIVVLSSNLLRQGKQAVVDIDVAFAPELQPAKITDAWLFGEDAAIQCEIPAGLAVGGGRSARIPTGSLMF